MLHPEKGVFYFITFTCFRWLPLLEETKIYDYLHFWYDKIREKGYILNGFVIMPNHFHFIVFATLDSKDLSRTMGEAKRFLAYEIVKRLKKNQNTQTLNLLSSGVQIKEKTKGKKHQVFRLSFDAKVVDISGIDRVLDYVHQNPVSGKWTLSEDFVDYPYSSVAFYEKGEKSFYQIEYYRLMSSE